EADDVSRTGRPGAADLVGARGAGLPAVRRLSGEHRPRDSGLSARAALTVADGSRRAAIRGSGRRTATAWPAQHRIGLVGAGRLPGGCISDGRLQVWQTA